LLAGIFRLFVRTRSNRSSRGSAERHVFSAHLYSVFDVGKRLGDVNVGAGAWLWALFPNAIILPFQSISDAVYPRS